MESAHPLCLGADLRWKLEQGKISHHQLLTILGGQGDADLVPQSLPPGDLFGRLSCAR